MEHDTRSEFRAGPLTVIVAEKDRIARITLAAVLSSDGYRVFQAEDVKSAISCIDNINDCDVLIANFATSEVASVLRYSSKIRPDLVVISIAGVGPFPENEHLNHCSQGGVAESLLYKDLPRLLANVLERRQAA